MRWISDTAQEFYSRSRWQPFPSNHLKLQAQTSRHDSLAEPKPIQASDLPELCAADEAMLRQEVTRFRSGMSRIRFAFLPDAQTMDWRHGREEFFAREFSYPKSVAVKGALVQAADGSRVWCVWAKSFNSKEPRGGLLEILRIVVESQNPGETDSSSSHATIQAIAACLRAAQDEASHFDMNSIEVWNPSPWVLAAARELDPQVELIERDRRGIICMKWFGPEDPREIELVASEAFEWC